MRNWLALALVAAPVFAQVKEFDAAVFKAPPARFRGHAMWSFPLGTMDEKYVVSGIEEMAKLNYGGFFIEAGGGPTPTAPGRGLPFLSDEYFRLYKIAMEEAKKRGMEVVLYDDWRFPTGTVGGQMAAQHSDLIAKTLEMAGQDGNRPGKWHLPVPNGIYMGAVRMNRQTFELVDISDRRNGVHVFCDVPGGKWKVMLFYLSSGRARVVDYLDEKAMDTFVSMTYEKYKSNIGSYFG